MSQPDKRPNDRSDRTSESENPRRQSQETRRPSIVRRSSVSQKVEITRELTEGTKKNERPKQETTEKKRPPKSQEKEPPKLMKGSEERIQPRYSHSEIKNIKSPEGYYEKEPIRIDRRRSISKDVDSAPIQYEEVKPNRNGREEKKTEEDEKRPGAPCKPCSAEGGFHRVEVRVIKSEDETETEDETNIKLCDNKSCPNKGGYNKTYGGRKKSQKITRRRKYGDDSIYLCDNTDCSQRSNTNLPGKLAICGKNKGDTARVIEFCGNNLRIVGSSKKKGLEDKRGSDKNRKKKRTICLSDPDILEQLSRSKVKTNEEGTKGDSSKVEITEVGSDKKFIIYLNQNQSRTGFVDDLETSSLSRRRSDSRQQSICYCVPDSYSIHEREGESNQGSLSAILIFLIILLLIYLYYPSSSYFFC